MPCTLAHHPPWGIPLTSTCHSEETLKAMAGHVVYEQRMWDWARQVVDVTPITSPEHNASVEAFLLHSRVLAEFFTARNPKPDDVVAADYVSDWTADDDIRALDQAQKSIHKRLAHLSTLRLDDSVQDQRVWSDNAIRMNRTWVRFLESLSPDRTVWFSSALAP